jgi:hypothetical protein
MYVCAPRMWCHGVKIPGTGLEDHCEQPRGYRESNSVLKVLLVFLPTEPSLWPPGGPLVFFISMSFIYSLASLNICADSSVTALLWKADNLQELVPSFTM